MEAPKRNNQAHLDEMMDLMRRFNYEEQIGEGGVKFTRENKPNLSRVKLLLEDLLFNKGDNLSFSDQEFLMEIFSSDFQEFIKEHYSIIGQIEDKDLMLIFISDLYELVQGKLRSQHQIKKVIYTIQQELLKNASAKLSPRNLQAALQKNAAGKIIESYADQKSSYALIKTNDNNHYRVDIVNNKVLQCCGETMEKAYAFQGNKMFVFQQHSLETREQVQSLIEMFLLTASDTCFGAFIRYLEERYGIQKESLSDMLDGRNAAIDLAVVYEAKGEVFTTLIMQLLNHGRFVMQGKTIYMLNEYGGFASLGTRKSIEKPKALATAYKGIPGIQIPVIDRQDKKHIIVSNGQENDEFETE